MNNLKIVPSLSVIVFINTTGQIAHATEGKTFYKNLLKHLGLQMIKVIEPGD